MATILDWGAAVVLWLQQASPALDRLFSLITDLGSGQVLALCGAVVFLCVDRRTGVRLALLLFLSGAINEGAKLLLMQPRPFQWDPRVHALIGADGYGLPSGHAQGTAVLWGFIAISLRRRWLPLLAGAVVFLVSLSRVYLGVHFPTDVLGGWALAGALLYLFHRLSPPAEDWISRPSLAWQVSCVAVMTAAMYATLAAYGHTVLSDNALTLGSFAIGVALERRFVGFEAGGPWPRRLLAFIIVLETLGVLDLVLQAALGAAQPGAAGRLAGLALVGLAGGLGAPWLMKRLGAGREARA